MSINTVWLREYVVAANRYLDKLVEGQFFAAEDMHRDMRHMGFASPEHPNHWGIASRELLRQWIEDGRIVQEGGKNGSRRAHGQFFRTYRKL